MKRYFLGVDVGNTKSHALIADETGRCVSLGATGPGNHEVLGVDGFRQALNQVVQQSLQAANIGVEQIAGAGYGIAGYDWPSDRQLMDEVIATLGINAPYAVENDSFLGLIAGTSAGWGVSVSAGTSGNSQGRDRHGNKGRITGNGAVFGEYGGGVELVAAALQAVSRAWSLRGPQTSISERFVQSVGAKDVSDLLEGLARGRYRLGATNAPLVFEAAAEGDAVAHNLLVWISRELGNLAMGIVHQLDIADQAFEVVMAGSFYKGSPVIAQVLQETIHEFAPHARLIRLDAPPVVGGVMLGMEQACVDFVPLRATLIQSASDLLEDMLDG